MTKENFKKAVTLNYKIEELKNVINLLIANPDTIIIYVETTGWSNKNLCVRQKDDFINPLKNCLETLLNDRLKSLEKKFDAL